MKELLYTFFSVLLIFSSCNPVQPNNTLASQNIYSVIDISNSPERTYNSLFSGTGGTSFQVLNGSFSYTSDTWTQDWISGQKFPYTIALNTGDQIVGCADVEIRTYNNTNLINTENFQIGYSQLSPPIFCDNLVANNSFSKNIQIVAD